MKLIINGEARDVKSATLDLLLEELDYEHAFLATARNGELVSSEVRNACALREGDRIEILSPMQGG
ncbi:sulfur carrier protein ThiS [Roseibium sp.]|uniref:sulfur carrier protein ThiS n=1 Tax=Roseibium sp. TaxID=1936156 RepID=UPI003BB04381